VPSQNYILGLSELFNAISSYYAERRRVFTIFDNASMSGEPPTGYYVRFLLERKFVVEYKFESDRDTLVGTVSLGIGPAYFMPADFWNYENSQRFSLDESTEAIRHNLGVLDEFLGAQKNV
jgi:hypothetical protein